MFPVSPALAADSLPSSHLGFPGGSAGKEFTWNVGDLGSIPRLGRSREEGKGYSLQYSGLKNFVDCVVLGVAKSQTRLNIKYIVCNICCRGESSTQRVFMSFWPILPCLQSNWVS